MLSQALNYTEGEKSTHTGDHIAVFSMNLKFACEYTAEKKIEMSCNFTILEKYLRSSTWNFSILFLKGDW